MGIPAFYRWLTERYPKTVTEAVEETPLVINGVTVPISTSDPNPIGVEFDNLYLDMNGIIHPCFHPEDVLAPSSFEEVFEGVFKYIDKIFSIVRPRKLLFMAIDGVAPRAKMNQQRSRRFRAAKDAADETLMLAGRRGDVFELEEEKLERSEQLKKLDSNVITPGTEFMDLLSSALRYYIHLRLNKDPGWQGIKVILSDATVPGEGEHKIMSYIRLQRNLPGYDPNTRHCLYGLDADLIMLALASHEVHFTILREDIRKAEKDTKKCVKRKRTQKHDQDSSQTGKTYGKLEEYLKVLKFQLLNIWVLREYLAHDMRIPNSTIETDLERLIDDFVFICLFIGNDFLPHIPSLEISEGAINLLMAVYKKEFIQMGGYLTNSFEIDLSRLEHFVQAVGSHECAIFRKRFHMQKEKEAWIRTLSVRQHAFKFSKLPLGGHTIQSRNHKLSESHQTEVINLTEDQKDVNLDIDMIRLGEAGWKERYYGKKFEVKLEDEQERIRRNVVMKYIEGVSWVMRYYYEGVCSWQWFYPYHYAPFASDFCGISQLKIEFSLGKPFKPFDQLMGVLPAARKLMTDASSPILDFYPSDFELDMNGKRFSWQAICKLPFIEESRLLSEIAKVEHTLTDEERQRNSLGLDSIFFHTSHPLGITIIAFIEKNGRPRLPDAKTTMKIDPKISGGMNGYIYFTNKPMQPSEIYSPINGMEMITCNEVLSVFYEYPCFHPHIPRIPKGVILPNKSVNKQDMPSQHNIWHETTNSLRVSSRRPIKNAISGARLARCARLLISKTIPPKQQDHRGSGLHASERLGGMKPKTKSTKRWSACNNNTTKDRYNGGKDHDAMPNEVEKVEGFSHGKLEGSCVNPPYVHGLKGMRTENSELRKRKRNEDAFVVKNNVQASTKCVEESDINDANAGPIDTNMESKFEFGQVADINTSNVEKSYNYNNAESLKRCTLEEQKVGDYVLVVVQKKKKRRARKRRRVEDNNIVISSNKNLESSAPVEQRLGNIAQMAVVGVESSNSCILKEQKAGDDVHTIPCEPVELKAEVKHKKKRKAKKKKQVQANSIITISAQNSRSCALGQQNVAHAISNGLEGAIYAAPSNNNIQKLDSLVLQELKEGGDTVVGANGVGNSEVKSKKKRQKAKRRKQNEVGVTSNSLEKLELVHEKPIECTEGGNVAVGGLEATEVQSKKRKRKSKERKQKELDCDPTKSLPNLDSAALEKLGAVSEGEPAGVTGLEERKSEVSGPKETNQNEPGKPDDNHQVVFAAVEEAKTEIQSNKRKPKELHGVLGNNLLNLELVVSDKLGVLSESNGAGVAELEETKFEVGRSKKTNQNEPGKPDDSQELGFGMSEEAKTESKKKKHRSKKRKQNNPECIPDNTGNTESVFDGIRELDDGCHVGVGRRQEKQIQEEESKSQERETK